MDPVARQIGAVNTLIRQPDGTFKGYNTDWSAAIGAIERQLSPSTASPVGAPLSPASASPLQGKTFLVLGAGGAGRALAFGAASRGAKVLITNRSRDRAEALAAAMPPGLGATVVDWEAVQKGEVRGGLEAVQCGRWEAVQCGAVLGQQWIWGGRGRQCSGRGRYCEAAAPLLPTHSAIQVVDRGLSSLCSSSPLSGSLPPSSGPC